MKKQSDARLDRLLLRLPLRPPIEVQEAVKQSMADKHALIYKAGYTVDYITGVKSRAAEIICTACRGRYYQPLTDAVYGGGKGFLSDDHKVIDSGTECACDICGARVKAVHVSKFRRDGGYGLASRSFIYFCDVDGHAVMIHCDAFKTTDKNGFITYSFNNADGVLIFDRKCIRISWMTYDYYGRGSYTFRPAARAKFEGVYYDVIKWDVVGLTPDTLLGTELENSAIYEFIHSASGSVIPAAYIKAYLKYPHIENLVRQGHGDIVRRAIELCCNEKNGGLYYYKLVRTFDCAGLARLIDLKKAKPHEMLGIEKGEMHLATALTCDEFMIYSFFYRSYGVRLSRETLSLKRFSKASDSIDFFRDKRVRTLPPVKLIGYLEKHDISYYYFSDHLNMVSQVYGEIPPELIFPRDIRQMHERLSKIISDRATAALNKEISDYAEALSKMSYEDAETGLMIRPCVSHDELIREGKLLHHCVATYAKSVAARLTAIFFIRRMSEPEVPFYTLEYKNGRINQDRGYGNELQTPEILSFEEKWLCHVTNIKNNEKERENGKQLKRRGSQRIAGA